MTIIRREQLEALEHQYLSPRATFADASRGRDIAKPDDPFRTCFQRDRDRILHCKAFRRLSHKTQVFLAPEGDHYRTRLTHTLEVSQIARSVARALGLNEDLTEAVALGHDLGHTPFGHTGEAALAEALAEAGGLTSGAATFEHNLQSLMIVEHLEYEGKGLNLTWEVRDGIRCHTGSQRAATLEGQIVAIADRIAYVNHDIDDAVRAGVLDPSDLPAGPIAVLGEYQNQRITTMVTDLVETSAESDTIEMSPRVRDAMLELRTYMFDNVYLSARAKSEEPRAARVVKLLFEHFVNHPDEMPPEFRPGGDGDRVRCVVDYVAGMTDRYAIRVFEELYVPKKWLV